jgi:hypothetical protein
MNEQHKNLIEKIKEVLPKEETRNSPDGSEERRLGYNECLYKVYRSLPQVMEVIKGEIEEKLKDIDSATNPMWIRKQIIDLITLLNDYESYLESKKKQKKETLKEIMKDSPDIMRGKDLPTKHGILSIGKLISKKK